jgi:flagellar basal-body rod protein FlgF
LSNALITAVQSMQNDVHYLDTISQNMVNIATPGYKRAIPVANAFAKVLNIAEQDSSGMALTGLAPILGNTIDLSHGPMQQTGRPWDLAISGDGYFELATPDGPAYSRAGNFRLDSYGRLISEGGFAVQGTGGDIVLNGSNATIDHTGHILQEGDTIGQIKIVRFADAKAMVKTATGLLRPANTANAPTEVTPDLLVGHLENSNVSPMREMVSMMETTRHFESAQKLFQGYDDMLGTAIQKLGEF